MAWDPQRPQRMPLDVFGTVGGDALEVTIAGASFGIGLDELRTANAALAPAFD